ncbi:unnamed protein product [Withania somnifera]
MAKSQVSCAAFLALFFCFLIASTEMKKAEAIGCETPSATWKGACVVTEDCDNQCIKWEGAIHGACHLGFGWSVSQCYCYFC